MTQTQPPQVEVGRVVGSRYRLRRFIARGGMAGVWEATDEVLGRAVAIKLLLPHLASDPSFLERFRREAVAAARLAHPNVVATYDTGVDGDVAFIVMELVLGTTLRSVLTNRGALPAIEAVSIVSQVLDALHYAHRSGIVHRDVKPANILIGGDGRVKVADFGIAKAAHPVGEGGDGEPDDPTGIDLTGTGGVMGTAKYLSPEQVSGHPVDARSDVYSVGVVLYEMICGRPPFVGTTDMAVGIQHLSAVPVSPRSLKSGIPPALEAAVLQAMAKAPDDRHVSAAAMQNALQAVDLAVDDAIPNVVADITPPRGTVLPAGFARSERRWLIPAVGILVVALVLGVAGVMLSRSGAGRSVLDQPDVTNAGVRIASVTAFDPSPGDGHEHDELMTVLIDGNPSTIWYTSSYSNPLFGGLKPGLGLVIDLGGKRSPRLLEVVSSSRGWSAEVAATDGTAPATRAAWGPALDSKSSINGEISDGEISFDLGGKELGLILLWITDLGPGNASISIGELTIT